MEGEEGGMRKGGGDWRDAETGGMQRPGLNGRILPWRPQREAALLGPRFQTPRFQNCEGIHF